MDHAKPVRLRFGLFEADLLTGELYENGVRVPIQDKPFQFLAILLESGGAVVTRERISSYLWPDTHVQVDQGLNAAARKVRLALRDDALHPRYIETLGSRGYRFICPVERVVATNAIDPGQTHLPSTSPKIRISAHECYLRGRHLWDRRTPASISRAIDYFQQAISSDNDFALAYVGLADAHLMLATYGFVLPKEGYARAKEAATRALQIDEQLAEAYVSLAWAEVSLDYDWARAGAHLDKALSLKPDYAFAHHARSYVLITSGEIGPAIAAMRRAREIEPVSLPFASQLSSTYYYARHYERAATEAELAIELDPHFPVARACLGMAYMSLGRVDEAISEFQQAVTNSSNAPIMAAHLAYAYAVQGNIRASTRILSEIAAPGHHQIAPAYHIALVQLALNDDDAAFDWLDRACEGRFHWTLYMRLDPRLDSLRGSQRFQSICERINLPGVS